MRRYKIINRNVTKKRIEGLLEEYDCTAMSGKFEVVIRTFSVEKENDNGRE